MFKGPVAVVTLVAFSLSSASCAAVLRTQPPSVSPDTLLQGDGVAQLKALVLKSGERIEFSKSVGARFTRDRIVAVGLAETVRVAEADLETAVLPGVKSVAHAMARSGVDYTGEIAARKEGTITLRAFMVVVPTPAVREVVAAPVGPEPSTGSVIAGGVGSALVGTLVGAGLVLLVLGGLVLF